MIALASAGAGAQTPPAIRQLGRLERVTTDGLESAADALPMPGGRVLVNDPRGRRVLLFDSTLAHPIVVADTTSATASAYTRGSGGMLFLYRGDSAVFLDATGLTMYVIGPAGTIARVMAFPPPPGSRGGMAVFGRGGVPAFDARGRLVYFNAAGVGQGTMTQRLGAPVLVDGKPTELFSRNQNTDSAFIIRADLATRTFDTVTALHIIKVRRTLTTDSQGLLTSIQNTWDPLPVIDEWTMLPDGSIAVVRARDYHVDWLSADGRWSSTPKMPFDWQRVSDERKQTLIDSAVAVWRSQFERSGGATATGRGRAGGAPDGTPPAAPNVVVAPRLTDLPDYVPPLEWGERAVRADANGNLWIRTTTRVGGQPVYDIVNRRGEVVDRVQLPSFRAIAGFGPGVIYMAMKDAAGVVHLERSRIK
jgi:hypothetical protein